MKKILTCLFLFTFVSCQKEEDCCDIIDVDVVIIYENEKGEDLLNPENEASFDHDDIKIYFDVGGNKEYAYQGNLDYPNFHYVNQDADGKYHLVVYANTELVNQKSVTFIELNESTTDTLRLIFKTPNQSLITEKIWYNGELKFPTSMSEGKVIKVKK